MVDVARLTFEFDATSATAAEQKIASLEKASGRLDQAAARTKAAFSGGAFEQASRSAGAYEQSMKSLVAVYGQVRDAAGRFTAVDGAFRHSQEATALMTIRNAQAQAALAKEHERAAAVTASYATKIDRLRASLDPFAAIQTTLVQRTKLLDDAMAHGAITADQHAAMLSKVTRAATNGLLGIDKYSSGLKNGGHYATQFSFQLNDIVTGLVSGQKPMQVLAQQGGQVAQIFQMAAIEAGGFKAGIRALTAEVLPFIATFGPWIAGLAAVGAAVFYVVDQQKKQAQAIDDATKRLNEQRNALGQISPLLNQAKMDADLAADGQRNFDEWLRKTNVSLAEQIRLQRIKTLTDTNEAALKAAEELRKNQEIFDKLNKPGASGFSTNVGGFGTISAAAATVNKDSEAYKKAAANLKAAQEDVDRVQRRLAQQGQAPDLAFGKQAESATRAAAAVRGVSKAAEDFGRRAAPIEESALAKASEVYWPEAAAAAEAYKKQQDAVKAATDSSIKTFDEQTRGLIHMSSALESLAVDFEDAARQAYGIRASIEDIGYAIKNGDWTGAFAGLFSALDQVQKAFADGATSAQKFAAISGVGQGVGSLIGGKTGSAISGAASGAQAGFQLGGPWGAAAGAALGGLTSILGASAAKAEAKMEALRNSVEGLRAENKTSSGSISGALEQANKNWNSDLEYSSAMVTSLRSIDNQIGALANALSRQITAGGLLSTSTLGLGTTSQGPGTGTVLASGLIAKILPGLFGSKTNTELLDQGLAFNPTTYGQGVTGSTYADIVSTTTKKFLGVTTGVKVRNSTVNGAIDPSLLSQINGIIEALGNGVLSAASVFGVEAAKAAESALGSAVVDLGKLSLKGLSSDEIANVLQATFDKVGDQLAAAGVPGLDKLATVGEGAFETLTRLAREYQVVDTSLAALGKTFGQVGLESLAARDNLVQLFGGLDAFTSATSFFATNFLTDAEQLAPVIKAVNDNLKAYGLSAESSRDTFKALVLAQDLTTEAGRNTYAALLNIAPAFDKVASSAETMAEKVKSTIADAAAQMVADVQGRVDAARSALQASYDAEKTRLQGVVDAAGAAESALRSAYDTQASSIQGVIDKAKTFSQSMRDFGRSILSEATGSGGFASAQAEYQRVRGLALAGDATAQGQFQSVAQSFLKASQDYSGSALAFMADRADVLNSTEQLAKTADTQASVAEQQLAQLKSQVGALIDLGDKTKGVKSAIDELLTARGAAAIAAEQLVQLDAQVAGLLEVNTSVLSVKDAILGLNAAIKALADAKTVQANGTGWMSAGGGVAVPTNPGYSNPYGSNGELLGVGSLTGKNAAGQTTFAGFTAAELAWTTSPLELGGERTSAAQAIIELKKMYGPNVLPGFAKGGAFMINGFGGIDQNLLSINGQPAAMVGQGEIVTVTPPSRVANDDGKSGLVAEVRALRNEVSKLRQDNRIIAAALVKATNQPQWSQDWDVDGLPPERVA